MAGSTKRKTGIAILEENKKLEHYIVYKDYEIIKAVKNSDAKIVVVDAPLSLPKGRKNLRKSNIHFRACDIELKKMRIPFFPITLGPMRMLTKRGMKLRENLEKLGYKVVESYPGAVQDLSNMPRSKDREGLRKKLNKLGIKIESASADELDAITCALVGIKYLKNEALIIGKGKERMVLAIL